MVVRTSVLFSHSIQAFNIEKRTYLDSLQRQYKNKQIKYVSDDIAVMHWTKPQGQS